MNPLSQAMFGEGRALHSNFISK